MDNHVAFTTLTISRGKGTLSEVYLSVGDGDLEKIFLQGMKVPDWA